jgi:hypothetical protein
MENGEESCIEWAVGVMKVQILNMVGQKTFKSTYLINDEHNYLRSQGPYTNSCSFFPP